MLLKTLKTPLIHHIIRRNVSALYVAANKSDKYSPPFRPYFDFKAKLQDKHKLEENIRRRKLNIDLNEIHLLWSTYTDLSKNLFDLEQKQQEIQDAIRSLDREAKESEDLLRKYKIERQIASTDLKELKNNSSVLEETFIDKFLDLPNDISERTPLQANEVHFSYSDQRTSDTENHLNKVNYLEYHDPFCFFLQSDAAECDLKLPLYCLEMFSSYGFIPFSNPDFIRSILAEGAGVDVNELLTIVEDDLESKLNPTHLAGSGSMLGFLGFVTKLFMYAKYLPLKVVSSGKAFSNPDTSSPEDYGLYSVSQMTNVQLFGMTINESESLRQFDETVGQMIEFYKRLDRTFRVRYVTGDQLNQAENCRAVFEMYSPHRKCFIPVGNLSSYGDYICKRLLISFRDGNVKQHQFPHLISGSLINVTKYLAILLEDKGVLQTRTM